jgi:hypothetical protein
MIVWNDIAKVRMKINYKRFWMRLRISLGSGGFRCYREMKDEIMIERRKGSDGWIDRWMDR